MAEIERPHRSSSINSSSNNNKATTDFFICFSSSSSMRRHSSKSIHSPARSASLTASLSRRLQKNASSGVFSSPMFGAKSNGRKRSGSGYGNTTNNIEPSSPKVTCIGQVRVKTRNHVKKKMRARSRRKGNTSLRRSDDGVGGCRFTICDSLRELNCFFPCRSSCAENGHQNRDRDGTGRPMEETVGKRREIESVVMSGEGDAEEDRRRSRRRHVFEELDISAMEMKMEKKEIEEVGCISSISSPPKNALLLMRCRSDPVKVAALANRVRERQLSLNDDARGGDMEEEEDDRRRFQLEIEDKKRIELCEKWISGETTVEREIAVVEAEVTVSSNSAEERVEVLEDLIVEAEEIEAPDSFEEEIEATIMKNVEEDIRNVIEEEEQMTEMEDLAAVAETEEEVDASVTHNREPDPSPEVVMSRSQHDETTDKEKNKVLPDSLLLMMCEPKLSMEVSKETWVCSTDFARCVPSRPPGKKIPEAAEDHHHQSKKRIITAADSNASSRRRSIDKPPLHQALLQPPRSSCSYPAAPPIMAAVSAVGKQKVAEANKVCEPPVLPRCNSEPRKSASKLAPETCFWKNRKLEPHTPATVGVGAAGIGV